MREPSDLGRRLRQIRQARGKSLAVVAGLAGISEGHLSRLERGERALDRRSVVINLAEALEVAPSDITGSALAAPGARQDDLALADVRIALLSVGMGEPGGDVQPVAQLTARVEQVIAAQNDCQAAVVGAALPALIRDLHTTAAAAQHDKAALLRLLTLAHMQGTQAWLTMVGAPLDLSWLAATLARQAAQSLDEPVSLAVSTFGTSLGLLGAGAVGLANQVLTGFTMPTADGEQTQLAGMLALASSLVAAARRDGAEQASALEHAAELAERTGETNAMGFGFGPSNVAVWRMQCALEAGEYADAAQMAETVTPDALTVRAREAVYWRDYGRALARLPRQHTAAVEMLHRAELISPEHVHQHPFTRSLLAELLSRAHRDAAGRQLRGMAYRAGLPV